MVGSLIYVGTLLKRESLIPNPLKMLIFVIKNILKIKKEQTLTGINTYKIYMHIFYIN